MANKKITSLTELTATPASGDMIPLVDVDDTTGASTGTTKRVSVDNLISEIAVADMTASAVVLESEGIGSNDNDTSFPTSAAVKDYVDSNVTAQDLDFQGDSGGALAIDLDSESLTIAGGTGISTVGSSNTVTASIDATVATLTGTQTLTNKTLTDALGTFTGDPVDIAYGGSGEATAQLAINALTGASSSVTDDYVLTKNSSDNAVWAISPTGPTGATGTAGATWLTGADDPVSGTGSVGDFYINSTSDEWFEKTDVTTWTSSGDFTGDTGVAGPTGSQGDTGATGSQGDAGDTGATGSQGATGADGDTAISGTPADNQVAVWTGATTIEGTNSLVFDSTGLGIGTGPFTRDLQLNRAAETVVKFQATDSDGIARLELMGGSTSGLSELRLGSEVDSDIGMIQYNHSTEAMGFTVNAVERMSIDSGGDVKILESLGIGVLPSVRLHVYKNTDAAFEGLRIENPHTGSSGAAALYLNAAGKTLDLRVKNSAAGDYGYINTSGTLYTGIAHDGGMVLYAKTGKIGIGTDSPNAPLEIKGVSGKALRIQAEGETETFWDIYSWYGNSNPDLRFNADGAERVQFLDDGECKIVLAGDADTYWHHPAANTLAWTTAGSERMRITSDGDVKILESLGIGITPNAKCHIHDASFWGAATPPALGIQSERPAIVLYDDTETVTNVKGILYDDNKLEFSHSLYTANDWGFDERVIDMVIADDGSVGIGTDSPNERLHVACDNDAGIRISAGTASAHGDQNARIYALNIAGTYYNDLELRASETRIYGDGTERMTITSGGQVSQPIATTAEVDGTFTIDFNESNLQEVVADSDTWDSITLETTGLAAGRTVTLRISDAGSMGLMSISWPGWANMGGDLSAGMDMDAIAIVELTSWGTSDSDVSAVWSATGAW